MSILHPSWIYLVRTYFFLHRQEKKKHNSEETLAADGSLTGTKGNVTGVCVCVLCLQAFLCPPLRSNPATQPQKQVSQQPSQHWSNKCTMGSTAGQLSNNNCRLHPTVGTLDTHTCAPAVFTSALIHVSNLSGHITHVVVCGCGRAPWCVHLTGTKSFRAA